MKPLLTYISRHIQQDWSCIPIRLRNDSNSWGALNSRLHAETQGCKHRLCHLWHDSVCLKRHTAVFQNCSETYQFGVSTYDRSCPIGNISDVAHQLQEPLHPFGNACNKSKPTEDWRTTTYMYWRECTVLPLNQSLKPFCVEFKNLD